MKTLNVNLPGQRYSVIVGPGLVAGAGKLLAGRGWNSPPIVVTNRTVMRFHGDALMRSLGSAFGIPPVIYIGDGERFKTHATLMKIYRGMLRAHADRRSWVLAFGGGVVGDIAGFAAATFMRGIPFVMVPTTLLAQIDSSIGGKVAVNIPQGKNLIGAFHQPAAVLSDTDVLRTLPKRELASGLYEVVKHAAIRSEPLLRYLENGLAGILQCRAEEMTHVISESVRIKAAVVAKDEKENNLRMVLNYGHTIGHSFEAATDYKRFKHGEAVAWGMVAATRFGCELGFLRSTDATRLMDLIFRVGKLPSLERIPFKRLWNAILRDKKFRSGDIRMILLPRIGDAVVQNGIDPSMLQRFLRRFLSAGGSLEIP